MLDLRPAAIRCGGAAGGQREARAGLGGVGADRLASARCRRRRPLRALPWRWRGSHRRRIGAQRDLNGAHAAGHQSARHRHGMRGVFNHNHRHHRRQRHDFLSVHQSIPISGILADQRRTSKRFSDKNTRISSAERKVEIAGHGMLHAGCGDGEIQHLLVAHALVQTVEQAGCEKRRRRRCGPRWAAPHIAAWSMRLDG